VVSTANRRTRVGSPSAPKSADRSSATSGSGSALRARRTPSAWIWLISQVSTGETRLGVGTGNLPQQTSEELLIYSCIVWRVSSDGAHSRVSPAASRAFRHSFDLRQCRLDVPETSLRGEPFNAPAPQPGRETKIAPDLHPAGSPLEQHADDMRAQRDAQRQDRRQFHLVESVIDGLDECQRLSCQPQCQPPGATKPITRSASQSPALPSRAISRWYVGASRSRVATRPSSLDQPTIRGCQRALQVQGRRSGSVAD